MDPDKASLWYRNIKPSKWITPKPLQARSRIAFEAESLGKKLRYVYEVSELSDNRLVMKTADGPFPMETSYAFEAAGPGKARMTLRNRGNPSGFSLLFAPFISGMRKKENKKDLPTAKAILEKDGSVS